jgi:hypothetical protein
MRASPEWAIHMAPNIMSAEPRSQYERRYPGTLCLEIDVAWEQ